MVLWFMILWCIVHLMITKYKGILITNPIYWLGMGWLLCIGLYYTCGFNYSYELKISGLLYFILIFVLFALSFKISQKNQIHNKNSNFGLLFQSKNKFVVNEKIRYKLYFFITILGIAIYLIDLFSQNNISSALHHNIYLSKLGVLGKITSTFGLILWLRECIYAISNNLPIRIYAFISAGIYLTPAMLTSGRQSIIILGVSTFSVIYYSFDKVGIYYYKKRLIAILSLGVIILALYVINVSTNRLAISIDHKIALFNFMFKCDISDETIQIFERCGPFKILILETVSYYSHELSMFQVLFDNWEGPLFLGASQFQLISRNLPSISIYNYNNLWSYIEQMSTNSGLYSHVWRTIAGNCIIDFGSVGGLFFISICGYISGIVYIHALKKINIYNGVLLALICSGAFFCIQFSPFAEGFWYYPLIWLLVLPYIDQLFYKKERNK